MTENRDAGEAIQLTGQSGQPYSGRIYAIKNGSTAPPGKAIAVLSNSLRTAYGWEHQVNSIYNTDNPPQEVEQFQSRNDISHLILLPYENNSNGPADKVDDLIRKYIHR
ncbi:MAG TPA: hypothetical protein VGN63_12380 [Flavisolibacter sp.]|jgi:hypothetical protein|nr:hypothetical protein [Flavisolibacter sp.]